LVHTDLVAQIIAKASLGLVQVGWLAQLGLEEWGGSEEEREQGAEKRWSEQLEKAVGEGMEAWSGKKYEVGS
jgi:hypothetical protein